MLLFALLALLAALAPNPAHAQAKGAACPTNGYTAAATQATGGQNLVCSSLAWAYVPYQFGASAGTCPGTSNVNLGIIQWTGSAFQGCTGSGWGALASGGATALSSLTSATAAYSFDNTSMAQTWTWNSLTTQTAFTLSSSSLTNGNILSIQNTAASATSTGKVLSISDATTGSGYGVYSSMTGHSNTGYAGYFLNTDTGADANYGVYGTAASSSGYGGYFSNSSTGWALNATGTSYFNGFVGIGTASPASPFHLYGNSAPMAVIQRNDAGAGCGAALELFDAGIATDGWGIKNSLTACGNLGDLNFVEKGGGSGDGTERVTFRAGGNVGIGTTSPGANLDLVSTSTGAAYALRSTISGAANTGYAGYFQNTATTANYGVYSTIASTAAGYGVYGSITGHGNTGYAGYFINTDTSTSTNYGVYGIISSTTTATGTGVYGEGDCASCTGVKGSSTNDNGVQGSGGWNGVYGVSNAGNAGVYGTNSSTTAGYGVYGTITGHGNTGYAGYFINTDTSINQNFGVAGLVSSTATTGANNPAGVYGKGDCLDCAGVYGSSANNTGVLGNGGTTGVYANTGNTSVGYGVYSSITGHGNTGYAGYFSNTDTSNSVSYGVYGIVLSTGGSYGVQGEGDCGSCNGVYGVSASNVGVQGVGGWAAGQFTNNTTWGGYGVEATTQSTGAGYGVYGSITGHGNTGYAGYFSNTDTSSNVNYGIYAIDKSPNGYGVAGISSGSSAVGVYGYGVNIGVNGTGGTFGVYGTTNNATGSGVFGTNQSTGIAYGVQGQETGTPNTGYAGYFTNTDTASVSYGLYASTSSATGWAGYFQGNVYVNGTITMSSDKSLKKDIEPLDTADALDEIAALRPVAFTWKKTGVEDMGLIAQEVDLVYPDLVTHGGVDETLALKYTSLIAPMIASIQELKKRDDDLEIENTALRRDFEDYKAAHP